MKLQTPISPEELGQLIDAKVINNGLDAITGINEIHKVAPGDLTFVDHPKYYDKALQSAASAIIINKEVDCPAGKVLFISDDPFIDYNWLTRNFSPFVAASQMVSPSAIIGDGTIIQPGAFVGNNVQIGNNCLIHANVSIYDNTIVGNDVIIHANTVLGSDAFYFQKRENGYNKLYSCGRVVIENKVEIGSGCTIDKGVSGDTVIGEGTKMDNSVHIGHGTVVGKHCLFAAQVGIAGKTTIEDNVILWGQVGVSKDLTIGANAEVYAQSGIGKSMDGGKVYFGSPAKEAREMMKEMAIVRFLPEMWEKFKRE